jgi:hypothetical protein
LFAKYALLLCLVAAPAYALTVSRTETRMEDVQVCIMKQAGDPSFLASYRTYDENGLMREVGAQDMWDDITPTQQNQVKQVINGVYNMLHQDANIPTPTPRPTPSPTPTAAPPTSTPGPSPTASLLRQIQ